MDDLSALLGELARPDVEFKRFEPPCSSNIHITGIFIYITGTFIHITGTRIHTPPES